MSNELEKKAHQVHSEREEKAASEARTNEIFFVERLF